MYTFNARTQVAKAGGSITTEEGGRKTIAAKVVGDYKDKVPLIQEDGCIYEFTEVVAA